MGSNMQRQGVPLLVSDSPWSGPDLEARVAQDSKAVVLSEGAGIVASVTGSQVIVTRDGSLPDNKDQDGSRGRHLGLRTAQVHAFEREHVHQPEADRPQGQHVNKGDVIADGPNTEHGELALGRNVLVAFMPWNGYNFEDAILISERVVKEDIYTSIHIDEFEIGARDTKLGPEEITRDIPNVSEEALQNLGPDGVIRIGAEVKPGDILVGKITRRARRNWLRKSASCAPSLAKAADVKDTSLTVPSGTYGIVMDVKVSSKKKSRATR